MKEIANKIGRKPHSQLNQILMDLVKKNKIGIRKGWKGTNIYLWKDDKVKESL